MISRLAAVGSGSRLDWVKKHDEQDRFHVDYEQKKGFGELTRIIARPRDRCVLPADLERHGCQHHLLVNADGSPVVR